MGKQGHFEEHWNDVDRNPAGGVSSGRGFAISWQNGPLGRGNDRREPNGAFVEDVIQAVIGRISFYQKSKFQCASKPAGSSGAEPGGPRARPPDQRAGKIAASRALTKNRRLSWGYQLSVL